MKAISVVPSTWLALVRVLCGQALGLLASALWHSAYAYSIACSRSRLLFAAAARSIAILPINEGFVEVDLATREYRVRRADAFKAGDFIARYYGLSPSPSPPGPTPGPGPGPGPGPTPPPPSSPGPVSPPPPLWPEEFGNVRVPIDRRGAGRHYALNTWKDLPFYQSTTFVPGAPFDQSEISPFSEADGFISSGQYNNLALGNIFGLSGTFSDVDFVASTGQLVFSVSSFLSSSLVFVDPETGEWFAQDGTQEFRNDVFNGGAQAGGGFGDTVAASIGLSEARFLIPTSLASDAAGNVYVGELSGRLRQVAYAEAGSASAEPLVNAIINSQASFADRSIKILTDDPDTTAGLPAALAVHPVTGQVFVGDALYGVLGSVDPVSGAVTSISANVELHCPLAVVDGPISTSTFCSIAGLSFNADGSKLYILDRGVGCPVATLSTIRVLDMETMTVSTTFGRTDVTLEDGPTSTAYNSFDEDNTLFYRSALTFAGTQGVLSEFASGMELSPDGNLYINEACARGGVLRAVNVETWTSSIVLGDPFASDCGRYVMGSYNRLDEYDEAVCRPSSPAPPGPPNKAEADVALRQLGEFGGAGNPNLFSGRLSSGIKLMTVLCGRYYDASRPLDSSESCEDAFGGDTTVLSINLSGEDISTTISAIVTSTGPVVVQGDVTLLLTPAGMIVAPSFDLSPQSFLKFIIDSPNPGMLNISGAVTVFGSVFVVLPASFDFPEGSRYLILTYGSLSGGFGETRVVRDTPGSTRRMLAERDVAARTDCSAGRCRVVSVKPQDPNARWIAAIIILSIGFVALLVLHVYQRLHAPKQTAANVPVGSA